MQKCAFDSSGRLNLRRVKNNKDKEKGEYKPIYILSKRLSHDPFKLSIYISNMIIYTYSNGIMIEYDAIMWCIRYEEHVNISFIINAQYIIN